MKADVGGTDSPDLGWGSSKEPGTLNGSLRLVGRKGCVWT